MGQAQLLLSVGGTPQMLTEWGIFKGLWSKFMTFQLLLCPLSLGGF